MMRRTDADYLPNYSTVNTDYDEGKEIFEELRNDGVIVWVKKLSPKGRKMTTMVLKEFEKDFHPCED